MPNGRPRDQPRTNQVGRRRADWLRTTQRDERTKHKEGRDHDGRESAPIALPGSIVHANRMIRTALRDGKDKEVSGLFAMGEERV